MIILRKPATQQTGGGAVAVAQTLTGDLNGANKIFQTPHDYEPSRISIMYNGQSLHSPEDFSETGSNEIMLNYIAPYTDDILRATYEYLGGTAGSSSSRQSGQVDLSLGDENVWVSLDSAFSNADYAVAVSIENVSDSPSSIYSYNITAKSINGFEVTFTGDIDSNNYVLNWIAISE
jgi:hypothetical protein